MLFLISIVCLTAVKSALALDIDFKDAVGNAPYCKVFSTGIGQCDFKKYKECVDAAKDDDTGCVPKRDIGHHIIINKHAPDFAKNYAEFDDVDCIDIMSLPFSIIQKIDNHHYELQAEVFPRPIHLILETKKAVFTTTGHPIGIGVRYTHQLKRIMLQNGFETQMGILKECGIAPIKNHVTAWPGMSIRQLIKGE